jgi:hypothetical protein
MANTENQNRLQRLQQEALGDLDTSIQTFNATVQKTVPDRLWIEVNDSLASACRQVARTSQAVADDVRDQLRQR